MSSRRISSDVRRHLAAGELETALVLLKAAFVSYPGSIFFAERLITVAHDAGDIAACRQALDRARSLGSTSRVLTLFEPKLLVQEGEFAAAAERCVALLSAEPPEEAALRCAADVLGQLSHPGVLTALHKLATHGWLDPGELLEASRKARQLGDHEAGHGFLDRLLLRHPHHAQGRREQVQLCISAPEQPSSRLLPALAALAEVDLPAAIEILPDLLRRQEWQAVLFVLAAAREAGLSKAALRGVASELSATTTALAAALAKARLTEAAAILLCLAEATGPDQAPEICARAAAVANRAVAAADSALAEGDRDSACETFLALMPLVEHGGLMPSGFAELGERLGLAVQAAKVWLRQWRTTQDDAVLQRAVATVAKGSSPCAALAQFMSVPGMPLTEPAPATIGLNLARAANEELTAAGGEPEELWVAGAKALVHPDAPETWPRGGVRGYAGRLRQSMKQADEAGDRVKAIRCAEAAIALDPEKAHPYKVLARLLTEAGQVARAREALGRLCDLEPEVPDHAIRLARRCRVGDGAAEALDALLPALSRHPRHAELQQMVDRWLCEPVAPG